MMRVRHWCPYGHGKTVYYHMEKKPRGFYCDVCHKLIPKDEVKRWS